MHTLPRSLKRRAAFITVDPTTHQPTTYYPTGLIQTDEMDDQRSSLNSNSQEIQIPEPFHSPAFPTTPSDALYSNSSSPNQDQFDGHHQGSRSKDGLDRCDSEGELDGALNALDSAMKEVSMGYNMVQEEDEDYEISMMNQRFEYVADVFNRQLDNNSMEEGGKDLPNSQVMDDDTQSQVNKGSPSIETTEQDSKLLKDIIINDNNTTFNNTVVNDDDDDDRTSDSKKFKTFEKRSLKRRRRDIPYDITGPLYKSKSFST
ncbi:hypothetical protein CROQUDRAFT_105107 [Cronartium quercuum f. sp. fusiforme G11]|uniref:Uncharacterized protein n=1 Tax=Cronartium quercuum f. sp. fusiforme G11 TaxID=708437 RepID=A0A9P6NSA1_9BASI|nr:hypothetical protein CROQUDRAFT_105107 [Cronartium quercuum f. sp. fusiforme G11]